MKNKLLFFLSIFLNVSFLIGFLLTRLMVIPREDTHEKTESNENLIEYSYLDNPSYDARCSMFDISNVKTAKIVFAGDSITGYGNYNEFYNEDSIVNRGIGSDISEGLYKRLDQIIRLHPEKVFIMIGINDIAHGISTDETAENVRNICQLLFDEEIEVYLMSVLPTCRATNEQMKLIEELNEKYELIGNTNIAVFIDLYPLYFTSNGNVDSCLFSADGVHLNGKGYQIIVDETRLYIE